MSEYDDPRPTADDPTDDPTDDPMDESTGDARVDEALTRLSELDDRDVSDHAPVVEDVHRALQDALAEEEA